ncbi:hypothetical protein CNECB9_3330013 [Cupriavidus necator]|uniref:Core-binding (CB) domain-containing protein n=1 Tax=Cupriavidus necator TaxID=106590 RepID=A0A1K0JC35_CUPNE|nr:hypothetical protein CNECB9_3330013 [Cupriavidus necator]
MACRPELPASRGAVPGGGKGARPILPRRARSHSPPACLAGTRAPPRRPGRVVRDAGVRAGGAGQGCRPCHRGVAHTADTTARDHRRHRSLTPGARRRRLARSRHRYAGGADRARAQARRRWWAAIPRLGATSARQIEAFFAAHPELTERARALIAQAPRSVVVPWEQLRLPHQVDGSQGRFRAPRESCTLAADNDYEAVQAWLALHESPATHRTYRKEAERLILWAIVERQRPLSSLTTEDAVAYRGHAGIKPEMTHKPKSNKERGFYAINCAASAAPAARSDGASLAAS